MTIKILLADDHPAIICGIKETFSRNNRFDIIGIASNGLDLIKMYEKTNPDVIVSDLKMPLMNGIESAQYILSINKYAKFLFYSGTENPYEIFQIYKIGGKGFLSKKNQIDALAVAIKKVHHKELFFDQSFNESQLNIMSMKLVTKQNKYNELTDREKQVTREIAKGISNKEIADNLLISIRTVEDHRRNIKKKCNLNSNGQLVKFAIEYLTITKT